MDGSMTDHAQIDGLWREIGEVSGELASLSDRVYAHPIRRPFRIGFGLAMGAALGIGVASIVVDHVREWKKGAFEAIRIEVHPRWRFPNYETTNEGEA